MGGISNNDDFGWYERAISEWLTIDMDEGRPSIRNSLQGKKITTGHWLR